MAHHISYNNTVRILRDHLEAALTDTDSIIELLEHFCLIDDSDFNTEKDEFVFTFNKNAGRSTLEEDLMAEAETV